MKINQFIGFVFLILFVGVLGQARAAEMDQGAVHQVTLKIDGISCGACVSNIRSALAKTPGVSAVEMKVGKRWFLWSDLSDVRAVVEIDHGKTTPDNLMKAVEEVSNSMYTYHARLIE